MFYNFSFKKIAEVYREDGLTVLLNTAYRYIFGVVHFFLVCKIFKKMETISRIQGNRMLISLLDPGISKELIIRGIHEKISSRELQKRVIRGMYIIDIGANIGYYALMEANAAEKEGKVYAIEPINDNFELLNRNIVLNHFQNRIKTFRMAVSDEIGTAKIYLSKHSNRHSLIKGAGEATVGAIQVPVTTIDHFVEVNKIDLRKLGLIRMDVEGAEARILNGMVNTMKQCRKLLMFIEWHPNKIKRIPGCSLRECLLLLKSVGARFDLLLMADDKGKILIRNKSIDEVLNSKSIMNNFMESWLTLENY